MLPGALWLPLLLLSLGCVAQESTQRGPPPASPCPEVYGYGWDPSGGWHGVVTIIPPARFSEAQLIIRMTVPYYQPQAGVGRVEIKGGKAEVQAISNRAFRGERHQIQFMIIFPPFDSLPRIKEIFINGKRFCAAKQDYPDTKSTIELKYVLKTGLNLPVVNGNEFSVVTKNPSRPDMVIVAIIQPMDDARPITTSTPSPTGTKRPCNSCRNRPQSVNNSTTSNTNNGDSGPFLNQPSLDGHVYHSNSESRPSNEANNNADNINDIALIMPSEESVNGGSIGDDKIYFITPPSDEDYTISSPKPTEETYSTTPSTPSQDSFVTSTKPSEETYFIMSTKPSKVVHPASRIVPLLESLVTISRKRYEVELERLQIERERLAWEKYPYAY